MSNPKLAPKEGASTQKGATPILSAAEGRHSDAPTTSGCWSQAVEYVIDATQRSVLYWDTMRQRGNSFREKAKTVTHVLEFATEFVLDGRRA